MNELIGVAADLIGDAIDKHCNGAGGCGNGKNSDRATVYEYLDDGSNIPLSDLTGRKKWLFIGINYFGSHAELRGCINDVVNVKKFVVHNFGFPTDALHMKTLVDDDAQNMPTRANMIAAMKWLVSGANAGDSLFLHYCGHGGHQQDTDGGEADGQDETLSYQSITKRLGKLSTMNCTRYWCKIYLLA